MPQPVTPSVARARRAMPSKIGSMSANDATVTSATISPPVHQTSTRPLSRTTRRRHETHRARPVQRMTRVLSSTARPRALVCGSSRVLASTASTSRSSSACEVVEDVGCPHVSAMPNAKYCFRIRSQLANGHAPGRTRTSDTRFRKPLLFRLGTGFEGCQGLPRGSRISRRSGACARPLPGEFDRVDVVAAAARCAAELGGGAAGSGRASRSGLGEGRGQHRSHDQHVAHHARESL